MAIVLSNPEDRKNVKLVLDEISNSMTRIEAEREYIKEAISDMADKYDLPKKILNRMARVYHKQNFSETVDENDELVVLYENVVGSA